MKRVRKITGILLFAILLFAIAQAIVILPNRNLVCDFEDIESAEAVIVLGALVYNDGSVSPVLRDRLDYALRLYEAGKVPKIIVSGDGNAVYDEVEAMKSYLTDAGVQETDIIEDGEGFNTFESMVNVREKGFNKVIISTQKFHSYRSLFLAKAVGLSPVAFASEDKFIYNMPYNHFREAFARIKAIYTVLKNSFQ